MIKTYITAEHLLESSYRLAMTVFESGYRPDFIIGVWRGGTPIGIAVQELLDYLGLQTDHIAIRTSSYSGIGQRKKRIDVHGLSYIFKRAKSHHSLLIVDDVFDTGLSMQKIIHDITQHYKQQHEHNNVPAIKVATPYFKPNNNRTESEPHYYLFSTSDWLVFPHELDGLSLDEALSNKQELQVVKKQLLKHRQLIRSQQDT